jgi:hypothetical protein
VTDLMMGILWPGIPPASRSRPEGWCRPWGGRDLDREAITIATGRGSALGSQFAAELGSGTHHWA